MLFSVSKENTGNVTYLAIDVITKQLAGHRS